MSTVGAISRRDLAASIAQRCGNAHETSDGWQACCPVHDDTTPSLSIAPTSDKVLLHCFAGCSPEAIVARLGLTMQDLFLNPSTTETRQIIAVYPYHDATGQVIHETVRYAPKTFKQRRPDLVNPGAYVWSLKGITPVLYHLPAVLTAIRSQTLVYIVEGEKDAEALAALGLVATCNPMGANKWRTPYSTMLQGARCVILPDNDEPGHKHAIAVATSLYEKAEGVKILHLPGLPGKGDVSDWLQAGGTREALEHLAKAAPLWTPHVETPAPPPGWPSVNGVHIATITAGITADWRKELKHKKSTGEVLPHYPNLLKILKHHERWQQPAQRLWWDTIRDRHMCGEHLITDTFMVELAEWLGTQEELYLTTLDMLKKCLYAQCEASPRDLIQLWLHNLPPWDHIPRLSTWLHDIVQIDDTPYTHEIARRLPVSMVARALLPGCQYREVIVLEGKENSGKSELVATLAGKEWYVVLSMNLETKESHMMLQRAWVAELAELDSLSRTEEARLKAFLTMKDDTYIPKYKNDSVSFPRRTVFIGTTNDETYLKGQTGNTRFLPIFLAGHIDTQKLHAMRDQLFAEALVSFYAQTETWWQMPDDVASMASEERELRRVGTDYEQPLHEWREYERFAEDVFVNNKRIIFEKDETTWQEIARWFLKIETPERWKDRGLQIQIATTLKAIGWRSVPVWKQGRTTRVWQKRPLEEERSSSIPF
jgi:hypothetical protein